MTYKVAAYLRLSKEEYSNEKESNSITNQKLIIDNYLKEHREYKLIDYYIDDGYSGTNFDRPEFQRILEDIKNKKIDVILIKDLSRLGRNYIETGNFVEVVFPAMGVSVISVDKNYEIDSSDYYSDDYLALKNLFNDMYAKDISKKVRSSLIVKKQNGEFVGKESVPVGDVFVDGSLLGNVNQDVIRSRETLAEEGAIIVTINYNLRLRKVVSTKDIVTKGLSINVPLSELSKDINQLATRIVNNGLVKKKLEMDKIEETLKEELGKLINRLIHHKPEIIPILIECSK